MKRIAYLMLMISACSEPNEFPPPPMIAVTDSGGIEVVTAEHPGFGAAPDVVFDSPEFRNGWFEGDILFQSLSFGHLRSDGSALAADVASHRIYVLSPDGSLVDSLGRRGQGPGEFSQISSTVLLPGDSLFVFDRRDRRGSTFAPNGELVRTNPLSMDHYLNQPYGITRDGVIVWQNVGLRPVSETMVMVRPVMASRAPHLLLDTIVDLPYFLVVKQPEVPVAMPPPLVRPWHQVAGLTGIVHVPPDTAVIAWLDSETGQPFRVLRWNERPQLVDDPLWDEYVQSQLDLLVANGSEPAAVADWAERLGSRRGDLPEHAPIVHDVRAGRDGSLWLRGWNILDEPRAPEFLVVLDSGRCIRRVRGMNGFQFLDSYGGFVLGVETSPLGEHALVKYRAPSCPKA